ncbi:hypothetical protein [Nannocystis radixulma]|uniref:NolW-like domain-containing protein n=1 Tax=Nannocystis radixulma TaxID=2995305 RepID=A0ABT5BN27_9BACT|nr:hypothetical protein [Nannocystis radixulma]MDC0675553.1 hypothetical protein [Nannocystis radixulma]
MVLARSVLAFTLVASACTVAHAARPSGPAKPVARRIAGPTTSSPEGIVAVRLPILYSDVHALAGVLKDILDVEPDRGDVRAILPDGREASLIVFATPEGHASVRRVLTHLLGPTAS